MLTMNADPIKYDVDKKSGALFVDRFMMTAMHYPANYGYVPRTIAADNDPVDVLVHTPFPPLPGVVVPRRAVGVLLMEDESGKWVKVIGWSGFGDAHAELMSGIRRFQDQLPD
jgi:inorganic pyrophosphatase